MNVSESPALKRGNHTILVVEDDLVSREVATRILQQAGYRVGIAADGEAALQALASSPCNLVLMDCHLPGLDGFELTRSIRGAEIPGVDPDLPVIALTSLEPGQDKRRFLEAGMNDVIGKPLDAQALVGRVDQFLVQTAGIETAGARPFEAQEFREAMIDRFLELVSEEIAGLNEALDASDTTRLGELGHRLKGSAAVIEASALAGRAHALEKAGKAGEREQARQLARDLIGELRKLTAVLEDG